MGTEVSEPRMGLKGYYSFAQQGPSLPRADPKGFVTDLLPYQTETYQLAPNKDAAHGSSGTLKVSYGGTLTNIGKDFLEVGEKYASTRGNTVDVNDTYTTNLHGVRDLPSMTNNADIFFVC